MQIYDKRLDEIKPYENNPRHNDNAVDAVANSIREFGFKVPLVVDSDGVIVAGHTRYKAAQKLGLQTVPCLVADDLNKEQINAFRLADNKVGELATWDLDKLEAELASISDIDMSEYGFDIEKELGGGTGEVEEDNFDEELPEEPISKLGDIYQLGEHRLMCGDSTNPEHVAKLMDGAKAELTFTDPPYELETKGGGVFKKSNSMKQVRENGVDSFDPSKLTLYSDTNVYCHNRPLIKKYIDLAEANGQNYDLCFYKKINTPPNYGGHMMTDCEYIAVIGKQSPSSGLEKELYSKCYIGNKDGNNKLSYSKPVGLCAKFIKLYSNKNVLDLFGGSGSTLIACEQLNRKCYMMELSPKYVDVIIKRWEEYTGKKAEKIC